LIKAERVSITKAKQRLGELVKRAAYGGERIVLEFRDKPQAAIVSIEDLKSLESAREPSPDRWEALDRLDAIRKRIGARTGKLPDSSEEIRKMREERVNELQGLR
jgi:prevent-host-death family protein